MTDQKKFRLVTRSDFDGLVCAVLLQGLDMIDDIKFVHPKDMQDGLIEITDRDITTNLPYVEGVHLAFDHHLSETIRNGELRTNHIIDPRAPSAARVVYDFYGGKDTFPWIGDDMMAAVDQADSAQYDMDDVLHPQKWALLNFLMDPRTGLGRFRTFRISNYNLMMDLIAYCRDHTIEQILELPDVAERVKLYFDQEPRFKQQLRDIAQVHGNVVVLDLRDQEIIHAGNRFMIYALFPETDLSIHVIWGKGRQNTVFAVGKSIFDRTNPINVGAVMLQHGGGGHQAAGTCQVGHEAAPETLKTLIQTFNHRAVAA
ncbi:MAG: exopolyphosphatase [Myxococcota bacterium]